VLKVSLEIVATILERAELHRPADMCSSALRRLLPL